MEIMGKASIASVLKIIMDVLWYLGFAGLALVGLLMVAGAFASLTFDDSLSLDSVRGTMTVPVVFELEEDSYEIRADALGIETAEMGQALSELSFNVPTGWFYQLNLMVAALGIVIIMWVLYQLRAVFATLRAGTPFVGANAIRIRWIGIAIIAGEVLKSLVVGLEHYYVMTHFAADGLNFGTSFEIQGVTIIVGFTVIVISEVFRMGTRLEEDQSLTV